MSIIQGIILGVLQGIAEFLPISSSGHLAIVQSLFNIEEIPLLFDVFLHLATLCSVVLYFRKKIAVLFISFIKLFAKKEINQNNLNHSDLQQDKENRKYIVSLILATLVTGVIGIIVEKKLDFLPIKFICVGFIITSVLLITSTFAEKRFVNKKEISPSYCQALIIGFAQGIGTLPGISRSGSTISASLFCGVTREVAGEFSFVVSIPAILGAFILELKDLGKISSSIGAEPVIAGCVAAFASGYIALTLLMKIIKNGKLAWFACYLIPAGILGLLFL